MLQLPGEIEKLHQEADETDELMLEQAKHADMSFLKLCLADLQAEQCCFRRYLEIHEVRHAHPILSPLQAMVRHLYKWLHTRIEPPVMTSLTTKFLGEAYGGTLSPHSDHV